MRTPPKPPTLEEIYEAQELALLGRRLPYRGPRPPRTRVFLWLLTALALAALLTITALF